MTNSVRTRARYGGLSFGLAIVFALFYAYVLWQAIASLLELPRILPAGVVPWWLLIVDVLLPPVCFVAAYLLGRRRTVAQRALLFVVGFALLACVTVGSFAYTAALVS